MNRQHGSSPQIGLIFGKFYPLHRGHIYLIEKALTQVDELHVMLGCEETRDQKLFEDSKMPVQPQVSDRLYWLQQTFCDRPHIHIHVLDEAGIAFYPNGWKDWSDRVKQILAEYQVTPTVIFTSEPQDAEHHQHYFGCPVTLIDVDRDFINISATKIRQNPYQNWDFLAKAAKPFFVKKVAIIGTDFRFHDLATQLTNIYNTEYVSNGYTHYICQPCHGHSKSAVLNDMTYEQIASLHAERIDAALISANRVLFTSFDFATLHHYYQQAFNKRNPLFDELEASYHFDLVINKADFDKSLSPLAVFEQTLCQVEQLLK